MRSAVHGLEPGHSEAELLRIRIVKGEKLGKRDLFGVCDPYVLLRLEDGEGEKVDEVQLETRRKTRNPVWNESLTFRVTRHYCLRIHVYDENKIRRDHLLGSVEVDLSSEDVPDETRPAVVYQLKGGRHRSAGALHIALHWLPADASPSESAADLQGVASVRNDNIPEGWEEREDANGRTFYVNHILRTTQWERPSLSSSPSHVAQDTRRRRREYEERVEEEQREDQAQVHATLDANRPTTSKKANVKSIRTRIDEGLRTAFESGQQQNEDGEQPLPDGWDMQTAPNGRVFFIDHRTKTTTWTDPRLAARVEGVDDGIGPLPDGWEQRVHNDGRIFYIDHNSKRTQWEDPRFENEKIAGPAIPYSRDYKRKVEYLMAKLPRASSNGKCDLVIHRNAIFEDSYRQIMEKTSSELRHKLWIEFVGETGLDYGGVAREWCFLLSHEIFNPYYGLFEYSATDNYTLQINPHSAACNPDHLSYFHFIGRVMGMAIYHGKLLDAFFIRPFYKMMLGKKITLFDMESVDNAYYNSLIYVKDNDPEELELTFEVDEQIFGQTHSVELIEGGKDVRVTEENKEQYIDAVVSWRFVKRVEPQMEAVLKGLHEVVPPNLLRIFDASELELLMCGLQKIDVKDWKAHTMYKGGYGPSSPEIHNFWRCVLAFDNEMRARVLQFVSGTSRVPMNGFRELYGSNGPQKFTIERWGSPDMLPRAHTCFNRLDLPPYPTYAELKQKLITAIENSEIFSGVD